MIFRELNKNEYDTFARKHKHRNYLSSLASFETKEAVGYKSSFVGVVLNDEIIAACGLFYVPMMRKYFYAYAMRGLLVDYEDEKLLTFFVSELKKYLNDKNIVYLRIDPYVFYQHLDKEGNPTGVFKHDEYVDSLKKLGFIHSGFVKGFEGDRQARYMMTLDLTDKTEEQLLKEMDQQTRWSVNKSLKLGIKVKYLGLDEFDTFYKIMEDTANRKQFANMSKETYFNQIKAYGDDAKLCMSYIDIEDFEKRIEIDRVSELANMKEIDEMLEKNANSKKFLKKKKVCQEALDLIDKRENETKQLKEKYGMIVPLSVSYFVFYEDEVVYVTSGTDDELKKYHGPYAIQWHMILESLRRGVKRYNFYGTSGDFTKEASDYGVYEFKKGFNAYPEELIGEFILPIRKSVYNTYQLLKKVKG